MATKIEKKVHETGSITVDVPGYGWIGVPSHEEADRALTLARHAYRAGRQDEAAIRAAALSGLMTGSPLA